MKRIISVVSLLLVAVVILASCDIAAHEHSYAEEWSQDSDYHWHACTVENCPEQNEKTAHSFEIKVNEEGKPQNVCTVCGYTNDKVTTAPAHDHVFGEKYESNENFHWYACTVENCYETKDKKEHSFGNPETTYSDGSLTIDYTCVDCEYKKTETHKVESTVDNATQWNEIFKTFKLTDFSLDVYIGGRENTEQHNHCVVTDSAVYYSIPGYNEFYVVKNSDGSYDGYIKLMNGEFKLLPEEIKEQYFKSAGTSASLVVSFENNFEKFTYDAAAATYSSDEIIEATAYNLTGDQGQTLYCHTSEVKIVDGKIVYISCDYTFGERDELSSFTYYNIGMSNVEVPQAVIDEAKANGVLDMNNMGGGNQAE